MIRLIIVGFLMIAACSQKKSWALYRCSDYPVTLEENLCNNTSPKTSAARWDKVNSYSVYSECMRDLMLSKVTASGKEFWRCEK